MINKKEYPRYFGTFAQPKRKIYHTFHLTLWTVGEEAVLAMNRENTTDTHNNVDESQKHQAEQKKSDTEYITYNFVYLKLGKINLEASGKLWAML